MSAIAPPASASALVALMSPAATGKPSDADGHAAARQEAGLAAAYRRLWWWNLSCGLLHLVQAVAALIAAQRVSRIANFKLPMTTLFLAWVPGANGESYPQQQLQTVGLLPFAATTSGFAWLSAAAHFTVLLCFSKYKADLARGVNRFRWIEYAASSSLMIVLVAMLYGMYDVISLFLLGSVNACMNLFGDIHEVNNPGKRGRAVDWLPFIYGCFAGVVPWIAIFCYIGGSPSVASIPAFVWAILGVYLLLFATFPANMIAQYCAVGWWNDARWPDVPNGGYLYGEKVYQVLSLVAKSLLLWLVIGGVNQPNAYTQ